MAKYVVPPLKMSREVIIRCMKCDALYVPDGKHTSYLGDTDYEKCPICGYEHNSGGNRIPLWKYNLIKYFRNRVSRRYNKTTETDQDNDEPNVSDSQPTAIFIDVGENYICSYCLGYIDKRVDADGNLMLDDKDHYKHCPICGSVIDWDRRS